LTEYGVNARTLSKECVAAILNKFYNKIENQLSRLEGGNVTHVPMVQERVEDCSGYELHMYGGTFHRVPKSWRFPKCGIHDLWRQRWVGDKERQIPPLKVLKIGDVNHIDMVELSDIEKARKVGPNKDNRRMVTKCLTDMRFACNILTRIVTALGKLEGTVTLSAVDQMFLAIADLLLGYDLILAKERDAQKQGTNVV
jgi:hypothetical protein